MGNSIIQACEDGLAQAKAHYEKALANIRTGRADASLIEDMSVEHYGTNMPLNQIASLAVIDAQSISIQPWDKSALESIEKAILASDIGITPNNNGERILLSMPPMTEETREQFVKRAKKKSEEAKISVRNIRETALRSIKKSDPEISDDEQIRFRKIVQDKVDTINASIDTLLAKKEEDIMTL